MKRLFVSAALAPLLYGSPAGAETKVSTATTAPLRTSTAASGQPDSLLIESAGSVRPTAAGTAVTADSQHAVTNQGTIGFNGVNNAVGLRLVGGAGGLITNSGAISLTEDYTPEDADKDGDLDGPFAQGSGRFGIRASGPGAYAGEVRHSGTITVEGADSGGILLETRLAGSLISSGSIAVTGDRSVGLRADSVSGDVRVTGAVSVLGEGATAMALGDIDGALVIQSAISATGYRTAERLADTPRGKLDADDLRQGGPAVRLFGSVAKGVLLDRPPPDASPTDKDEDKDGVDDVLEGSATITSFGGQPALWIGGPAATVLGAVGGGELAYGLVNKGTIRGAGVNDGVAATALRIGDAGGSTRLQGGLNNFGGAIAASAFSERATGVLVGVGADVAALRNSGSIEAVQTGGKHDARAVVDLSGTLARIDNFGVIQATVTPPSGQTATGRAVAIDLSANTTGAVIRQAKLAEADKPAIRGEVRFGAGADRLELLGGTLEGTVTFGGGVDAVVLDGGAQASVRLDDADGTLALEVRDGRLAVTNTDQVRLGSLSLGANGVLAVSLDPAANAATRFAVAGQASLAGGAQVQVGLTSLLRGSRSFEVVRAGALSLTGGAATLSGAPYLYTASLRADPAAGALYVDLRPKTAGELGLNRSGGQALAAVFDSLDKDRELEAAALAQTSRAGFLGLYDQLLPDHSGGALMSASAISAAVSAAAGQPMRATADVGQGVWVQEILFDIRRDRDEAAGFKSQGFGLAAGFDLLGETQALGLNLSFVGTDYRDRAAAAGEQVSMSNLGGGIYWRADMGDFHADARAGVGYVWFDSDRRLSGAGLERRAAADWTGWTAELHAGAAYTLRLGRAYARPELSADYLRLSEKGYRERGGGAGFDLIVEDRKGDLFTGQAAIALGARFGEEIYWSPELKVGWRAKLAGDPGRTTARFADGQPFTLDPEAAFDGGAVVRLALRGGSDRALYVIEGGGTFEDAYSEYDLRATARFQF